MHSLPHSHSVLRVGGKDGAAYCHFIRLSDGNLLPEWTGSKIISAISVIFSLRQTFYCTYCIVPSDTRRFAMWSAGFAGGRTEYVGYSKNTEITAREGWPGKYSTVQRSTVQYPWHASGCPPCGAPLMYLSVPSSSRHIPYISCRSWSDSARRSRERLIDAGMRLLHDILQ